MSVTPIIWDCKVPRKRTRRWLTPMPGLRSAMKMLRKLCEFFSAPHTRRCHGRRRQNAWSELSSAAASPVSSPSTPSVSTRKRCLMMRVPTLWLSSMLRVALWRSNRRRSPTESCLFGVRENASRCSSVAVFSGFRTSKPFVSPPSVDVSKLFRARLLRGGGVPAPAAATVAALLAEVSPRMPSLPPVTSSSLLPPRRFATNDELLTIIVFWFGDWCC